MQGSWECPRGAALVEMAVVAQWFACRPNRADWAGRIPVRGPWREMDHTDSPAELLAVVATPPACRGGGNSTITALAVVCLARFAKAVEVLAELVEASCWVLPGCREEG